MRRAGGSCMLLRVFGHAQAEARAPVETTTLLMKYIRQHLFYISPFSVFLLGKWYTPLPLTSAV